MAGQALALIIFNEVVFSGKFMIVDFVGNDTHRFGFFIFPVTLFTASWYSKVFFIDVWMVRIIFL
ncbi:hypothetical protein X474_03710 [Dethiosulfatarculus sandiegensis]|uniref:Uncharacterized protein n=1 Tax=Dethiosulfatarculus sandiegensis TaxID=1429043 RepID=A0A0D2HYP8_9BACT|nr:hypothetical protein X474_03710 [Dethiosulfatarculus sandiegensis]